MSKTIISTPNAPAAIGTYSQAVKVGYTVYLAGQIGLDPATMKLVDGIEAQIEDAVGLVHVNEIAASSPRLQTLVYGPGVKARTPAALARSAPIRPSSPVSPPPPHAPA